MWESNSQEYKQYEYDMGREQEISQGKRKEMWRVDKNMSLNKVLEEVKRDIYNILATVDEYREVDQKKIVKLCGIDLDEYLLNAGLIETNQGIYSITREGRRVLKQLREELSNR